MKAQKSSREVLAHCWNKKIQVRHMGESKKKWLYSYHFIWGGTAQCQERTNWHMISPAGKVNVCDCVGCDQRGSYLSHSTQSSTESWAAQLAGGRRMERQQIELSDGIKGTWILLTASWTPSRSLPTSYWGHFACKSLQLHTGIPSTQPASPRTPLCGWLPMCTLSGSESNLVNIHRKPDWIHESKRDHKCEL